MEDEEEEEEMVASDGDGDGDRDRDRDTDRDRDDEEAVGSGFASCTSSGVYLQGPMSLPPLPPLHQRPVIGCLLARSREPPSSVTSSSTSGDSC
jgi:hypothetical protein